MTNKFQELQQNFEDNDNVLKILSKFVEVAGVKVFYAIFGGFAIDAYNGKLTRFHEDVDVICWRKNVEAIRNTLKSMGYDSEITTHHEETKLEYILKTTDDQKTLSFQIADPVDDESFEISFWPYTHVKFPLQYLEVEWKELEGIKFPVVAKQMLIDLKQRQADLYEKTKQINEEKYLFKQKRKHMKALHDLQLLNK